MSRRLALVVLASTALGMAPGVANAAPPAADRAAPGARPAPATVSAKSLGIDASELRVPWRVERAADGSIRMFWGPGVKTLRLRTDTVATTGLQNAVQTADGPITAAGWYCNGTVPATVTKTGSQLQSYIGISCYNNRPGELRFVWWFDRSSWSGWRLYSREHRYTSWTSAQAFGTYIYNQCAGGGTYDYRARYDVESRNVGGWSWNTGTGGSGRFACGTNEP